MSSLSLRTIAFASCSAVAIAAFAAPAAVHAEQAAYQFNIPAQDIGSALRTFGRVARQPVIFDGAAVRGKTSRALVGRFSVDDGLRTLLGDSGLKVERGAQGVLMVGAGPAAEAGGDAEEASRIDDVRELDEIIVTAQKRSESIREVPASISALSGDQLEKINATQLSDFAAYIPGFQVDSFGPPGLGRLTLRGITVGTSDSTTVGTYVDEVPLGSSSTYLNAGAFTLDLMPYDIERVEVLRGPQGTLYGASTMGGLLKYVTRTPDLNKAEFRVGGDVSKTGGADDFNWSLRAGANIPLVQDKLAIRASAFYADKAGYIDNVATGETDVNGGTQKGGRLALLWQASPDVSVKLTAMTQETAYDSSAQVPFDTATQTLVYGYDKAFRYLPESFAQKQALYTATVNWDLGWADLTSATSVSKSHSAVVVDATTALGPFLAFLAGLDPNDPLPLVAVTTPVRLDKVTQELRLSSPTGSTFEWMLGAFYTDEDAQLQQNAYASDAVTGAPLPAPINPVLEATLDSAYREYALFGNATYRFTDAFDVSAGLRWAKNKQTFKQSIGGLLAGGVTTIDGGKSSEDVVTYSLGARYRITPDVMVYGRIASGYRPGGANIVLQGLAPSFGPDRLTNYEVGLRSQFLDRRVTFDLTAFHIDWTDIQISVCANNLCAPDNGGEARSQGFELSTAFVPIDGLRFGFNGAYTDAKLTALDPGANIPGAATGSRLPLAPRWSGAFTADYEFPAFGTFTARLGAGVRIVGSRNSTFLADPENVRLASYAALDLNVGLYNDDWKLSIYARNVTDEHAFLSGSSTAVTILEPRTIGLSLDRRF
jgi:iron complex outermembrane receptor protein